MRMICLARPVQVNAAKHRDPKRFGAPPVMDIGTLEDARWLLDHVGADWFRTARRGAEAGQLRPKSWAYWHHKLGLTPADRNPPPMPARVVQ